MMRPARNLSRSLVQLLSLAVLGGMLVPALGGACVCDNQSGQALWVSLNGGPSVKLAPGERTLGMTGWVGKGGRVSVRLQPELGAPCVREYGNVEPEAWVTVRDEDLGPQGGPHRGQRVDLNITRPARWFDAWPDMTVAGQAPPNAHLRVTIMYRQTFPEATGVLWQGELTALPTGDWTTPKVKGRPAEGVVFPDGYTFVVEALSEHGRVIGRRQATLGRMQDLRVDAEADTKLSITRPTRWLEDWPELVVAGQAPFGARLRLSIVYKQRFPERVGMLWQGMVEVLPTGRWETAKLSRRPEGELVSPDEYTFVAEVLGHDERVIAREQTTLKR